MICLEILNRYCKLLYESPVARNRNVTANRIWTAVIAGLIIGSILFVYKWANKANYFFKIFWRHSGEILKVKYIYVIFNTVYHVGASIFVISINLWHLSSSFTNIFFSFFFASSHITMNAALAICNWSLMIKQQKTRFTFPLFSLKKCRVYNLLLSSIKM